MRVYVLGSGSSGNCLLVEADGHRLVLDAGLGLGRAVERMRRLGSDLVSSASSDALGVFVTHEHGDHAGHAFPLAKSLRAPLFIHRHVGLERGRRNTDVREYTPGRPIVLGPFVVDALAVPHDAPQVALRVSTSRRSVAMATDLGHAPRELRSFLAGSDLVFLESNYCPTMLESGPYPSHLKARVRGPLGHLANEQAAEIALSLGDTRVGRVVLVHLSRTNNRPDLALDQVVSRTKGRVPVEVLPHGEPRRFDVSAGGVRGIHQQLGFSFA